MRRGLAGSTCGHVVRGSAEERDFVREHEHHCEKGVKKGLQT